jgi:VCBS repeat protein
LGTGGRQFSAPITAQAGTNLVDFAAADFNGDNKLDLVAVNHESPVGTVSILLGDGTGHFGTPTKFNVGDDPLSVATGDFNGDGNIDLVVANEGGFSDNVSVLLGNGMGSFGAATAFPVGGEQPTDVVVADFNGDSKLDLAVANVGVPPGISILFGTGSGSFVPDKHYGGAFDSMAVSDFNGDGKPDLVFGSQFQDQIKVLINEGNGGLGQVRTFVVGNRPTVVAVGDFNNDGKTDVATCDGRDFSGGVSILSGDGAGGFIAIPTLNGAKFPRVVESGDFNGDGRADLVASNGSVWLNDGMGGLAEKTNGGEISTLITFITVGDLNADGKLDLVKMNPTSREIGVRLGDGAGGLGTETKFLVANRSPKELVLADFNGDHKLEIVTANDDASGSASGDLSILFGNGAGGFATPVNFSPGFQTSSVAVGDFNVDGKADLAVARFTATQGVGEIAILLGNGLGGFATATTFNLNDGYAVYVQIADFNHDNKLDIAAIKDFNPSLGPLVNLLRSKNITIMLGNGAGGFSLPVDFPLPNFAASQGNGVLNIGDFNGDGNTDLTVVTGGNAVALLLGDGAGKFGVPAYFIAGRGPQSSAVADLNSDGKLDLATANLSTDNISILYGLCLASATPTPTPTPSPTPTATPTPTPTPTPQGPVLVTEENSSRAVALDSVTFTRDPFSVRTIQNFSSDQHTRIMLFASNMDLLPGEPISAVTAQAETESGGVHMLAVEYVGKVLNFNSLTQINVSLPDELEGAGNVQVSVSLHGVASNKALITIIASPPGSEFLRAGA